MLQKTWSALNISFEAQIQSTGNNVTKYSVLPCAENISSGQSGADQPSISSVSVGGDLRLEKVTYMLHIKKIPLWTEQVIVVLCMSLHYLK